MPRAAGPGQGWINEYIIKRRIQRICDLLKNNDIETIDTIISDTLYLLREHGHKYMNPQIVDFYMDNFMKGRKFIHIKRYASFQEHMIKLKDVVVV